MLLSNLDSMRAPIMLMKPMVLDMTAVCILDDHGHETPITQDMIRSACEDLLRRMQAKKSS